MTPRKTNLTQWMKYGLAFALVSTLVLTNFWLIGPLNLAYRVFFLLLLGLCCIDKTAIHALLSNTGIWIAYCVIIFAAFVFSGHGDRINMMFLAIIRNALFFMGGYSIVCLILFKPHFIRRYLIFPVLVIDSIVALRYLITVTGQQFNSRRMAIESLAFGPEGDTLHSLILHYPNQVLLLFLGIALLDDKSKWIRGIGLVCVVVLALQIMFSFWTSPILMMVLGVCIGFVYILKSKRFSVREKAWVILFLSIATLCVAVFFSVQIISSGEAGNRVYDRVAGALNAIVNGSMVNLDAASGSRIQLLQISLSTFFHNPLIGVGDYWIDGDIGGHSFWFDAMGKYGLVGFIPLFGLSLVSLRYSWNASMNPHSNWLDTAILLVIATWFFSAFLNPYFYTRIGYFVFFCMGINTGRRNQLKAMKKWHRSQSRIYKSLQKYNYNAPVS